MTAKKGARYRVSVGPSRWRYFDTLDAARKAASEIFAATGIVVAVEEAPARGKRNPTLAVVGANPGVALAGKIARAVHRIDYVHAVDGKRYTHDFAEEYDKGQSAVEAFVDQGGRRVILKARDGRPIVQDY